MPQKAQTRLEAGAAVLEPEDDAAAAEATAAAAATPTQCASLFLSTSSTCCTVNLDWASKEVVRAEYLVPCSRTEIRSPLSASSSK